MKYWIFLHHKCASQYLRAQISAAGQQAKVLTDIHARNSMRRPPTDEQVGISMSIATSDYFLDDNAWGQTISTIQRVQGDDWKGVELYRDPRDLLVSAYFSHRHSHGLESLPGLRAHRDALLATDIETGLLMEMDFYITDNAIHSIVDWPNTVNVYRCDAIEMAQDLAAGRLEHFTVMLDWIGIPLQRTSFLAPRWETVSGRAPGVELNTHHYRHGVQGDWRRYFTPPVEAEFTRRYGPWQTSAEG